MPYPLPEPCLPPTLAPQSGPYFSFAQGDLVKPDFASLRADGHRHSGSFPDDRWRSDGTGSPLQRRDGDRFFREPLRALRLCSHRWRRKRLRRLRICPKSEWRRPTNPVGDIPIHVSLVRRTRHRCGRGWGDLRYGQPTDRRHADRLRVFYIGFGQCRSDEYGDFTRRMDGHARVTYCRPVVPGSFWSQRCMKFLQTALSECFTPTTK